ncbi:MAG: hypothetical protein NC416_10960 [Eubacterium sp.]|nr:hypothetical protein [Eubacterium sp.]
MKRRKGITVRKLIDTGKRRKSQFRKRFICIVVIFSMFFTQCRVTDVFAAGPGRDKMKGSRRGEEASSITGTPSYAVRIPTHGNITGQYPEFMGTGDSYAASPEGTVDLNSPITFKMKYKPLEAYTGGSDTEVQQSFLSIREADSTANAPFFLLDNAPTLTSKKQVNGNIHVLSCSVGEPNSQGNCDLELTFDPKQLNQTIFYTVTFNGKDFIINSKYAPGWQITDTNGQVLIAYHDYPDQNGHMILYNLEIIQNGVTKAHYDGTRSFDGTRLIDISGNGRDAEINGAVTWHTTGFEGKEESEVILARQS